jgi:16S rRNA (cytidine1402-2'-O)-methyltransferase
VTAPARGRLLVVATPLGNLGDLSPRAARALAEADLVAAEDTRRTLPLLTHLGLSKPMVSSHKFNEASGLTGLLNTLAEGKTIALVTDGGTPAISDPGHRLVAAAHAAGHAVVAIAGPSAVAAALSVAGFPADRFRFAGFLPAAAAARRRALGMLATEPETLVFYEAPHRVLKALDAMIEALGDREAALCRELTKLHEEVLRAPLSAIRASLAARDAIRGEIVLVVAGAGGEGERAVAGRTGTETGPYRDHPSDAAAYRLLFAMARQLEDGDARRAMRRLARDLGRTRAEVKALLRDADVPLADGPG